MAAGALVQTSKQQRGLALLVLIIVIILAFSSYLLSGLSVNQVKTDQKVKTQLALIKAKKALLG
ncbi:MAG: hypothetical protein ABUK13_09815, partial [Gammaproteobacteria bacterium]